MPVKLSCPALTGDLQIAGEAADGAEALRQAGLLHPDVILLDLEMPVMDTAPHAS